jgi:hypothetical protein
MMTIEQAARAYLAQGWTPIAQADRQPIFKGFNRLTPTHPDVRRQGWKRATGIGILTGSSSSGLAAIDIDDGDFAAAVFAKFARSNQPFRWQWSRSNNGHLFVREVEDSYGGPRTATWQGREIKVDLKSNFHGRDGAPVGASLTCFPTPGYLWANQAEPALVETVEKAWHAICLAMGATPAVYVSRPEPWQEFTGDGSKNDGLYSEARALALARMPYQRAVELLRLNIEENYSKTIDRKEFEDTVRSAYRRFWKTESIAEDPRYAR